MVGWRLAPHQCEVLGARHCSTLRLDSPGAYHPANVDALHTSVACVLGALHPMTESPCRVRQHPDSPRSQPF